MICADEPKIFDFQMSHLANLALLFYSDLPENNGFFAKIRRILKKSLRFV